LHNLGLPSNREGDNKGFLFCETDGKKKIPVVAGDSHPIAYCLVPAEPVLTAQERKEPSEAKRDVAVEHELVGGKKGFS
jgi:hypothetical protein